MAFRYIIAGFCFLFLPNFALWDFIPDCIGYFLILQGIYRASLIAPVMADARRALSRLTLVSLFRFLSAIIISLLFSNAATTGDGYQTLFTIVFCAIETYFAVAFFRLFAEGLSYLQMRHGEVQFSKELTDFTSLSIAFYIVKALFNIFPTLGGLFGAQYSSNVETNPSFDIAYYETVLSLCNIVIVTAFGIVFLVFAIRLLLRVQKDSVLLQNLKKEYSALLDKHPTLPLRQSLRTAFLLFGASCVFLLDLSLDRINIIPDFVCAILLLCGCIVLCRRDLLPKWIYALCSCGILFSCGAEILGDLFSERYGDVAWLYGLNYNTESLALYIASAVTQILWQATLIALLVLLGKMLHKLIAVHTGTESGAFELHAELNRRVRITFILLCIYAASSVVQTFVAPFVPLYWLGQLLYGIFAVFYTICTLSVVREQVDYKYL